ncbi:hypothetical protein M3640_19765 [Bacillus velezensis]|nr:hypothetical protein [Bacillus velezensis]
MTGEFSAPNCTPLQTNLGDCAHASSHPVKAFCKTCASHACNDAMPRDNLYHNTI